MLALLFDATSGEVRIAVSVSAAPRLRDGLGGWDLLTCCFWCELDRAIALQLLCNYRFQHTTRFTAFIKSPFALNKRSTDLLCEFAHAKRTASGRVAWILKDTSTFRLLT